MTLKVRLMADLKEAMRARDMVRKTTIRLLLDAIHKAEIPSEKEAMAGGAQRKELSEEDILQVVACEAKKRREAIAEYEKGGREDLVAREKEELALLMGYLPEQLSREEIEGLAHQVVQELGAQGLSDMGKVMGTLMPQVRGRAEGRVVSEVVRQILGGDG